MTTNDERGGTYIVNYTWVDGEPMMDAAGVARILGVQPHQIDPGAPMPAEWIDQGRRR
jgi:hypothetical protein